MLDEAQRKDLARLADLLVPRSSAMPSASEAGVHTKWVDRALAVRPDLNEALLDVVTTSGEVRSLSDLDLIKDRNPAGFEALTLVVLSSYFMSPMVRKRLGYPGQRQHPISPDEAEFYLEGDPLAIVRARGPRYRQTVPPSKSTQAREAERN